MVTPTVWTAAIRGPPATTCSSSSSSILQRSVLLLLVVLWCSVSRVMFTVLTHNFVVKSSAMFTGVMTHKRGDKSFHVHRCFDIQICLNKKGIMIVRQSFWC